MHWDHRIGRRLKLRDLNILLAVAEAGSMAKAAKRLAISQPAVSRAVTDMERTLGVRLLDRSPQGIELNRYGRAMLTRGIAVFNELKQGVLDIDFLSDPAGGELHLGSGIALAEGVVQASIERLSLHYPRGAFHIELGDTATMYEMLRTRRIELGFAPDAPGRLRKATSTLRSCSRNLWLSRPALSKARGRSAARSNWPSW